MGCYTSRLEDEEAVQLCKDRRNLMKQAVEQRICFASAHVAYIQSLKRVSCALRNYVNGDEHHDFFDSYTTPPFTPVKRLSPKIIGIPLKSCCLTPNQSDKSSIHAAKFLRSRGNPSVAVEEWPDSPETVRIDSYYTADHNEIDGFFATQASPVRSFFSSSYDGPSYPPPSPQNSQWDFFWNPFSSMDTYGYPYSCSFDQIVGDDEHAGLRQLREEEGIPELEEQGIREEEEEEEEEEKELMEGEINDERSKDDSNPTRVTVKSDDPPKANIKSNTVHKVKELQSKRVKSVKVSEAPKAVKLEVTREEVEENRAAAEEQTPGFTVYLNRRPTSMAEVMKDIENQFVRICDSAHEVSVMLEASRAQYSSSSRELAVRTLNPVSLFRSASSYSSSSRFVQASSSSRNDGYESSSDYSMETCMISGSHQSTLDRLYAWEKKLYDEVKAGERIRIAYEKKCLQLRNQDVHGEAPSAVYKTRVTIRDLHTQLQVSIHSVELVSKRIEILRDEELHPQLRELIQGLARMWRTMADCHRIQKRTIEEAKLLLLSSSSSAAAAKPSEAARAARSAAALEAELRNWRSCLEAWIAAQRAYARALAGWALRCDGSGGAEARSPRGERRSSSGRGPLAFGACVQWSRVLESVSEAQVVDGLDFFAAGMGSVSGAQRRSGEGEGEGEVEVEVEGGPWMTPEKVAEVARRVLCAGISVAVSSLTEFAVSSAEGYESLVKRCGEGM
ncbi:protein ROLLING AND ERECT LEAF 2 [Phoenix dactylifera]|uniref:Protein ROLLING AND ERECT LEAF 2 n=1 Tax=Phoenix dactylifera TaxID=42345 RepID=A0A8B9ADF0_PHODC|nr:protein ROLLING AND ERECT LEAF 2 [Phoenix dactylifera]XP_038983776.1 protein ROLLING AND ERECT LEAF 2 [Phoenix dactylifera]XP_038983777.1 protein ROLLING AND ERECT LEAF 2 [Phoenix dactylifera]XP_038983778.1 protein ROLLING AND ERECT LEAF 2 [Phoenix dactylifera]